MGNYASACFGIEPDDKDAKPVDRRAVRAPPVPRLARAVLRALVERACAPEGRASNEGMVCGRVISCAAACSQTRPWR
jgi:hypothetical protein